MKTKVCDSWSVRIYIAGDPAVARQVIAEYCYLKGFCVTVTPTEFIYTGGREKGVIIGIENYPRFESVRSDLVGRAAELVRLLMPKLNQRSALIVDPEKTRWLTEEPPGTPK